MRSPNGGCHAVDVRVFEHIARCACLERCVHTLLLAERLSEHDAVRERTLEITFLEPGAEAYAFTFG
jgi:hypothetical protein